MSSFTRTLSFLVVDVFMSEAMSSKWMINHDCEKKQGNKLGAETFAFCCAPLFALGFFPLSGFAKRGWRHGG